MYSPLPVYTVPKKSKGWNPRKGSASFKPSDVSPPQTASSINAPSSKLFQGFNDMLDPALDGPPSPGRLRAVANQVRKNSVAEKHDSQQTYSSGSSSILSAADRPSWEHGIESLTVSRRSSQRSTTSSMPSRERPESTQIFSKSIFNRKGKGRRESSDLGSSDASLNSTEAPADAANGPKEGSSLKSLLTRRKTAKEDELPQSKIKISGPYNFQHLAHTEKENESQPARSGMDLAQDHLEMRRVHRPRKSSLMGAAPPVSYHSHYHNESFSSQQDPSAGPHHVAHGSYGEPGDMRHVLPTPAVPTRSVKRTQSQEQFRVPPPRPPRSPTEYSFESPIAPPPRTSSRASTRPESSNGFASSFSPDRFPAGAGIRIPQPIVFPSTWEISNQPILPRSGIATIDEDDVAPHEQRFSHAITTPDNAAWPLAAETVTNVLPDVPEEEENHGLSRSRMSMASNSSALRGSVSVPLLRQISQPQNAPNARPPSGASETLGCFNLLAAQRALRASMDDDASVYEDELDVVDNWEDDIDYCYDHAAEADCDYAWERPSMDMAREPSPTMDAMGFRYPDYGSGSTGLLSPPGRDDVPALSPVSQISNYTQNEAKTPTVIVPVTSNFSLPRRDSSAVLVRSHSHSRNVSHADSFKEAATFDLSPSLLIPGDYHQQMLLHERGELREEDEDYLVAPLSPSGSHFAQSPKTVLARCSASTTDSIFSNRHKSTTSTSTTLTRWTSTSTHVDGWQPEEKELMHASSFDRTAISPLPELEESHFRRDTSAERHARAQSHANFLPKSNSATNMSDHLKSGPELVKTRRRAKTTSRSHNQAPVSLGLFPSVMNNRV